MNFQEEKISEDLSSISFKLGRQNQREVNIILHYRKFIIQIDQIADNNQIQLIIDNDEEEKD